MTTTATTTLPEVTTEATHARFRQRRRRLRRVLKWGSALLVVLLARVAFDLYAPHRPARVRRRRGGAV